MARGKVIRVVAGCLVLALGAFLLLSLITHDPSQGPFPDHPPNAGGGNACGIAGAYVSAYGLALIGWAAYLPAVVAIAAGFVLVTGMRLSDAGFRIAGLALLGFGIVLGLAIVHASNQGGANEYTAGPGTAGGAAGVLLARWLYRGAGPLGTLILFVMASVLGVFLLAGAELAALSVWLKRNAGKGSGRLRSLLTAWKPARWKAKPAEPVPAPGSDGTVALDFELEESPEADPQPEQLDEQEEQEPEIIRPMPRSAAVADDEDSEELDIHEQTPTAVDGEFKLPPVRLLDELDTAWSGEDEAELKEKGRVLQRTLSEFKVEARVVSMRRGPVITMYELSLAPGTKLSKVESLADDLAIALKAPNVRIVAPLPGKNTVGIEVPNNERETVGLRELMEDTAEKHQKMPIPLFLGKDTAGKPLVLDLARCPHLLVAGATGSGKSVAINAMISSILMTRVPDEVQLLLIDPKSVEFSSFAQLPHLICPVVADMKKAASVLKWACKKMDERYALLSRVGVRNLSGYNALGEEEIRRRLEAEDDEALADDVPFHMPHIVIIVDEFGELMMVAAKEVEHSVIRLSQKARAIGIHLICATQRPSVDVITGLIKSNMPARVAFQVASKVDSRTILDRNGAELLLGRGDMLLMPPDASDLHRAQGSFVSEAEVERLVEFWERQGDPQFRADLREYHAAQQAGDERDELFEDAVRIVLDSQRGSVSLLQRRLSIGYSRAARLIDMMAEAGIVGPYRGSQARRVMMTLQEWDKAHANA